VEQLKIALVHAYTWPEVRRGGERLVDDLTAYLRGARHTVDVFCGTPGESRFHIGPRGRSYRLRIPWTRSLGTLGLSRVETFGLRALVPLLLHRYDVVHAFTPTAALAGVAARQTTLFTVLGHPTPQGLPEQALQRVTLSQAVARATEVVALSRSATEAIQTTFGRRPIVLQPGVRTEDFVPNLHTRSGPPRLLFSADLGNRHKGLPVLLAAFDRLLVRHPDARLALSGPGRADWALDAMPARERIEASIDVLGTGGVDDVPERYRSAHVTILPSRDEAFGIVLLESLACGTPVVACAPGGPEDVVVDDAVGRLVPFGDPDALAEGIEACLALAADASTPERCSDHAAAWDWTVIGPLYESVYASLAGRRLRPGARAARSAARPSSR
jgi:glycosyltransferase involved in cell wall biosynthesis